MKLKFNHPEPKAGDLTGPEYWRSLNELSDKPEFKEWVEREFPEGASEIDGVNRRNFLKIMSAGFAVAGLGAAGCRRPEQYILPYSKQPEGTIPGVPVYYTSSYPASQGNVPVIVETHQHRPTHIEGNKDFQATGGGTSAQISASVLDLYDPDRMTASYEGSAKIKIERVQDILAEIQSTFSQTKGQGLAVLTESSSSPSRLNLKKAFKKVFPAATWTEYDAVDLSGPEKATEAVFGKRLRPNYKLSASKRILALDADFLSDEPNALSLAKQFAKGRKVANKEDAKHMSRLYAVESVFSVTGTMADHRLRLETANIKAFAAQLAAEVLEQSGGDKAFAGVLRERSAGLAVDAKWISECAHDLLAHKGKSVVIPGAHLDQETQLLIIFINYLLGADGKTVEYLELPKDSSDSITALSDQIKKGTVEQLVVLGGNPVYNAPADISFKALLKKVPKVLRYGYTYDETSLEASVNIAASHYLEDWSDGQTFEGDYVPVQPMIQPIFETLGEIEFLGRLVGLPLSDSYAIVRDSYSKATGESSDKAFQRFLSTGFDSNTRFSAHKKKASVASLKTALAKADFAPIKTSASSLEIRIKPDTSVGDGAFNNNGWMQECPDPMTKLTWDNAIIVSPKLATELGFDTKAGDFLIGGVAKKSANFKRGREESRIAEITVEGTTVRGPIHILPGLADFTVLINLGYGREKVGRVGEGTGFSAYPLVSSDSKAYRIGGKINLTEEGFRLANTQEHWSMEGRAILREANVSTHLKDSHWVEAMGMESHSPPIYGKDKDMPLAQKVLETPRGGSAYETPNFGDPPPNVDVWKDEEARKKFIPEQQWGMSIDLNTCIGCQSCIVACQSENNIPIVGKDQIMRGREMHWIRLDRYYSSGSLEDNRHSLPADPQAAVMPVGCVHCEMAPCEQVCPVNATVHDRQGLNVMAYNRCVGTRYCANNCPYKVRRFNFFDYNKRSTEEFYAGPLGENQYKTEGGALKSMQKNPDVTVRMRGVMEKCTYCVQRIEQGKIAQRVKAKDSNNIKVPDGIIRTACQAACPTEAIVFGDITDSESAISKAKANDRDYSLLGYLNTRPRTTYLGRLRNPNPAMPDYEKMSVALSRKEYKSNQPVVEGHSKGHDDHGDHGH